MTPFDFRTLVFEALRALALGGRDDDVKHKNVTWQGVRWRVATFPMGQGCTGIMRSPHATEDPRMFFEIKAPFGHFVVERNLSGRDFAWIHEPNPTQMVKLRLIL